MNALFKIRAIFFFFSLCICNFTYASEKIKITKIKDTNLFVTHDSLTISLSNVKTFSITDADSFKRNFALKVFKNAEKMLLDRVLFADIQEKNDSLVLVHLWEKKRIVGKSSINEAYLMNGWGSFDDSPQSGHFKRYRFASENAKATNQGIHDISLFRKHRLPDRGVWLNAGLGISKIKDPSRPYWRDGFFTDLSAHLRIAGLVFSGGIQGVIRDEATSAGGHYLLLGKSFYGERGEMVLSLGGSLNRWEYNTESRYGIVKSDRYTGFQIKVQFIGHLKQVFGTGLNFDANINKELSYYALSLNLLLGYWHYAK
jgi:hypothetical protein